MVDYSYADLFLQDSVDKQLSIVSDDGKINITNTELHQESFELTESICSEEEFVIGSCEASMLKFTVSNTFLPMKGKWLTVTTTVGGHSETPFQIGRYKVDSDVPTADRTKRDVVAYDVLYDVFSADVIGWYNKVLPEKGSTITVKSFRDSFFAFFGIEQEEAELVNDSVVIQKSLQSTTTDEETIGDTLSGQDVLRCILEINGCFGSIGRNGKFRYIRLKPNIHGLFPNGDLYPSNSLFPRNPVTYGIGKNLYWSAEYEDFHVEPIEKIEIRPDEDSAGVAFGTGDNRYIITGNMLTYGQTKSELKRIASNILAEVEGVRYRPFKADCKGNPCVELGDTIRIPTKYALIESYIFSRTLTGIQSLKDVISADGEQSQNKNVNSTRERIIRLEGKSNTLKRDIDETRSELADTEAGLNSKIEQTAGKIRTEVDDTAKGLSSDIEQTAEKIAISVTDNGITTQLTTDKNGMTFKGNVLVIQTNNFTLDEQGNASFSGKLSAPSGTIGAWNIEESGMMADGLGIYFSTRASEGQATFYNGKLILGDASYGDYIPTTKYRYVDVSRSGIFSKLNGKDFFCADIDKEQVAVGFPLWVDGELHAQHANLNSSTNAPVLTFGNESIVLRSTSSSRRYKHDISDNLSAELSPDRLYDLDVVQYKFNDDYLSSGDIRANKDVIGLIAEDVADIYPIAADFKKDKEGKNVVEDWNYRYLIPAMLKLIQNQKAEIDSLKGSVSFLLQKVGEENE